MEIIYNVQNIEQKYIDGIAVLRYYLIRKVIVQYFEQIR